MDYSAFFSVFLFFAFFLPVFGQGVAPSAPQNEIVSVEAIQKSLLDKKGPSLSDTLKTTVEQRLRSQMQTAEITEQTVKSAVEGKLITEEVVPQVNTEQAKAVDRQTKRYSPRLALNFERFSLRPLSGTIGKTGTEADNSVIVLSQNARSLTENIAYRIQKRLESPCIRFEFRERTAILTGTVKSADLKELAETMLLMEPGIDRVDNFLTVK